MKNQVVEGEVENAWAISSSSNTLANIAAISSEVAGVNSGA
ncbi:hypothetical protein [Phenylobacterium sp.]